MNDLIARMLAGWGRVVAGEWGPPRVGGRQMGYARTPDLDNAGGE